MHVNESAGGGVERYLQGLIAGMDPGRFENVLVCSPDYREESFQGRLSGFEAVPQMRHAMGPWDIAAIQAVRGLIRKYQPDIVYAHSSKAGVYARLASRGMGCKCIYNPHGWAFNMQVSGWKRNVYAGIERWLAPMCDRIVCISEYERRTALERHIGTPEKLTVIMNGIDCTAYEGDCADPVPGLPEDAFVVGMVGRLSPQKAPDTFIRAAEAVLEKIDNAFFIMVGSGPMEAELRAFAAERGFSDRLWITGWVDNAADYIRRLDVAMLLSRWEGFGLALPEYMAAGKPVVATRAQAIPEIIVDGECGLLVDVDDWRQAASAVLRLHDAPGLARRLGENGRARAAERFSLKRVVEAHAELFDALTGGSRGTIAEE